MAKHSRSWKEKELIELKSFAEKYPVIAVADITGFPANLFQKIRKKLYGKAVIRVSNQRVVKKAFTESNVKNINALTESMQGSVAIIFTEMNPFELFQFLKKNKGKMLARAGMIAEEDIIVPAGDTGLLPGPALSDLKAAGLKARIQGPTIIIPEDTIVTKKGEPVSKPVEGTLQKLGIKPFKVGLNLMHAFESGFIYSKEVLDINIEQTFTDFTVAASKSMNLALNIAYLTKQTIPLLVMKAFHDALNLSVNANILNKETASMILGKVQLQAIALNELIDWAKVPASKSSGEKKE